MATNYTEGSQVTVTGTYSIGGTATDPTTVTISYRNPNGVVVNVGGTAVAVTNPSTGVYKLDIAANIPGKWHYQFLGAGTVVALAENFFIVDPKVI
jgi:DNA-binding beta-propeller fold protein YncE